MTDPFCFITSAKESVLCWIPYHKTLYLHSDHWIFPLIPHFLLKSSQQMSAVHSSGMFFFGFFSNLKKAESLILLLAQIWTHGTSDPYEGELVQLCVSGWSAQVLDKRTTGPVESLPSGIETFVETVEGSWPLAASCWTRSVYTAAVTELCGWLPG